MAKYHKSKAYNPYVQVLAMKSLFPHFTSATHNKEILFEGELKVGELIPLYKVSILYRGKLRPKAKIISPQLVEKPPHFYKEDNTLCLYHPNNYTWKEENLVAKDIIPWVASWIYFYEVWLEKGEWYGPEAKHTTNKIKEL